MPVFLTVHSCACSDTEAYMATVAVIGGCVYRKTRHAFKRVKPDLEQLHRRLRSSDPG